MSTAAAIAPALIAKAARSGGERRGMKRRGELKGVMAMDVPTIPAFHEPVR
jgi:hypothetical protein